MCIDSNLLLAYGATVSRYKKNAVIFRQDDPAKYYYQIQEGQVKTFNLGPKGKEFVEGVFRAGESFGEPSLFTHQAYPVHAMAVLNAVVLKLSAQAFIQILEEYPVIQRQLLELFAHRLYDQSVSARILHTASPELRILDFLHAYKSRQPDSTSKMLIPYTRQEIAGLTGLRVETVIRALAKLNTQHKVSLLNRKLYF